MKKLLTTRFYATACAFGTRCSNVLSWCVLFPVRLYQLFLSPILPSSCRFYPTCSVYMIEAVQTHGVLYGTWLGLRRLARCHPWSCGGVDPVPPPTASQGQNK